MSAQGQMSLAAAKSIAGSLGFPSKMPGTSYGLPVSACVTGQALSKVVGSICSGCYVFRDCYAWTNPLKAQHRRLEGLSDPRWVDAMVLILDRTHAQPYRKIDLGLRGKKLARVGQRWRLNPMGHHRWHDSGDLQSVAHLAAICEVARRTPTIRHWLPTQELGMVEAYLATGGGIPDNLTIRVSSIMLNDGPRRSWPLTATVFTADPPVGAHVCPARLQEHRCGDCRACWSRDVPHIAYPAH